MIVVSRFRVEQPHSAGFLDRARRALDAFAARPGFRRGRIGRAADDATLWALTTEWDSVGAFRRSLSDFGVKVHAATLLAESLHEPGAFEVLVAVEPEAGGHRVTVTGSARAPDADVTRVGGGGSAGSPPAEGGRLPS